MQHPQLGMHPPHSHAHAIIPHPQMPHPHSVPQGPHMRPPHDMYLPGGHPNYPGRRPSPPPYGPNAPPMPAAIMFPRPGTPPSPQVLPIRHLGTFVFPRTPFPFFDFPPAYNASGEPSDPVEIRATLYLPSRCIPLTRPARPRLWGGSLIPAVPQLTGAQRELSHQYGGTHRQYGRPWPEEVRSGRRVYTDDSDLFLCALHAGWVSWSAARRARREGRDLQMEVRLTREARYIGGLGAAVRTRGSGDAEDLGSEDDGSSLLSSGWGNGHDGAGLEVLHAEFVPVSGRCFES